MKPGWAYVGKNQAKRPFERWEEITWGYKKGMIKIWLSDKTAVVNKENVVTWPSNTQ